MNKQQVYEVDGNGYIKEIFVTEIDEHGNILDLDKISFISITPPNGLFKPKWTGAKWIEGATQEEIDQLIKVEPSPPTQAEILEQRLADLELMLAEILFN